MRPLLFVIKICTHYWRLLAKNSRRQFLLFSLFVNVGLAALVLLSFFLYFFYSTNNRNKTVSTIACPDRLHLFNIIVWCFSFHEHFLCSRGYVRWNIVRPVGEKTFFLFFLSFIHSNCVGFLFFSLFHFIMFYIFSVSTSFFNSFPSLLYVI